MKREFTFSDESGQVRLAVFISVFESWHMVQYFILLCLHDFTTNVSITLLL